MPGLTSQEVAIITYRYIGVDGGYLGDFTYASHAQFYPLYCDLDINPDEYTGTTRLRFMEIISNQSSQNQAKILRGVIQRFPVDQPNAPPTRTNQLVDNLIAIAERLEQNAPIPNLTPQITSLIITQAIADAETLIQTQGASSAVDRVHTAMHGYLRAVCDQAGIAYAPDDTMTRLLRLLRQQHPAFQVQGARNQDIERIPNALGSILESLNALRNHASLAHPNPVLLANEDAMLAINVTRTIFHYLDAKFR